MFAARGLGHDPEIHMNSQTHVSFGWQELYRNATIETNADLLRIRIDQSDV